MTHWSYFLIDADPVCLDPAAHGKECSTCWEKARPLTAINDAVRELGSWNGKVMDDPLIIHSGRGCQAWVRLEDIVMDDDVEDKTHIVDISSVIGGGVPTAARALARKVNGYWLKRLDKHFGLHHGCRFDTSVSDLPRVMRCPGTRNRKTGEEATIVNATSHVFRGLAHIMSAIPKKYLVDPDPPALGPKRRWQDVYAHLTRTAQVYLTQGQEEPGRHKVMWHTAKKLNELGVTREEARRALRWANKQRGPDNALDREVVEHALDTAYGML